MKNLVQVRARGKLSDSNQTWFSQMYKMAILALLPTLYRSGTVNSKSFVSKVLLPIKWKFELIYAL